MLTFERWRRDEGACKAKDRYGMWWDCAAYVYVVPTTMAEVETLERDKGRYIKYDLEEASA